MKILAGILLLSVSTFAHAKTHIDGIWQGDATVKGQQVPLTLQITGKGDKLQAALRNGPESSPATSAVLTGNHLVLTFNYFARTLDATLDNGTLTGTFGSTAAGATRIPVQLTTATTKDPSGNTPPSIDGDWEVEVKSAKGESAWQLRVEQKGSDLRAVIQRIDGDTGSLYGSGKSGEPIYKVSHFTAAGPALYSFAPQPDGTLLLSNLLNDKQTNLVAHRPAEARKQNLPAPTDPTQQTTLKDPTTPLQFSAPDLSGKLVSSKDVQFDGKVVIVAVGGSWCPNCHDEAPFLESLYKQFHTRGLEIVNLSFEEADQLKDPTRLHAFIQRYGITYTVLLAGEPEQLNEKITQANNLNCWPTSFFIGRDGRVKEIHAGFAGPANPPAHEELTKSVTALVEQLLAEPVPTQNASR
ncbi:redoxin domain-containing protein [Granulicella arctica]|uniref:Peroxiredoxin n=1 Tax=Granulicella arctica TaxID=940613 RepID=A0A7Y9PGX9_9BACT|nr:redoxin domain-containing protein [Granulicella arctica]NYF79544.1 peroxiredoxin [Granulicella arctica]